MAINPTADTYIKDLLDSNKQDFALIFKLQNRIKKLRADRYAIEPLGLTKANLQKVAELTCEILLCYNEIKHLRACVNGRLEEVKHVREVNRHGA